MTIIPEDDQVANSPGFTVRSAYTSDLGIDILYRILRLRVDVFVVEQQCPYPELDGRDLESGTRHFWIAEDESGESGAVLGYLRLLLDHGKAQNAGVRIGRVCTAGSARGHGLGRALMTAALAEIDRDSDLASMPVRLSAQVQAMRFYETFGFSAVGEQYLEDGIPHVHMCREHR